MEFLPEEIDQYSEAHTTPESSVLHELNRHTNAKVLQPRMLSGHLQGRLLAMFSQMIQPKQILEIGTYTGYSAICLAEGLAKDGKLHTIDINDELESTIRQFLERAGCEDKVHLHIGNALDIIDTIDGEFDLVFIDADKDNYLNYYNMVVDRVSAGGYIIADNVLWSGKVVNEAAEGDADTKALQEYAQRIHQDNRVENVLLPVRDGLLIARKK